jgi:hypothetical protein
MNTNCSRFPLIRTEVVPPCAHPGVVRASAEKPAYTWNIETALITAYWDDLTITHLLPNQRYSLTSGEPYSLVAKNLICFLVLVDDTPCFWLPFTPLYTTQYSSKVP